MPSAATRISVLCGRPQSATCSSPPGRSSARTAASVRFLFSVVRWWNTRLETMRSNDPGGKRERRCGRHPLVQLYVDPRSGDLLSGNGENLRVSIEADHARRRTLLLHHDRQRGCAASQVEHILTRRDPCLLNQQALELLLAQRQPDDRIVEARQPIDAERRDVGLRLLRGLSADGASLPARRPSRGR